MDGYFANQGKLLKMDSNVENACAYSVCKKILVFIETKLDFE